MPSWISSIDFCKTVIAGDKQEGGPWKFQFYAFWQDLPVCESRDHHRYCQMHKIMQHLTRNTEFLPRAYVLPAVCYSVLYCHSCDATQRHNVLYVLRRSTCSVQSELVTLAG